MPNAEDGLFLHPYSASLMRGALFSTLLGGAVVPEVAPARIGVYSLGTRFQADACRPSLRAGAACLRNSAAEIT